MHDQNTASGSYGSIPSQLPYQSPRAKKTGGGNGCLIALGAIVGLFVLLGACGVLLSAGSEDSSPSPAASASVSEISAAKGGQGHPSQPAGEKAPVNGIGRQYRDGKFAFTVTKVKKGVRKVGGEYLQQTAQGQYVLVYVTVRNIGNKARMFDNSSQKLIDSRGREFDTDSEATIAMGDESNAFLKDINPGNGVKGILIFDVPAGVRLKSVELHDSMFSGGVTVPLLG